MKKVERTHRNEMRSINGAALKNEILMHGVNAYMVSYELGFSPTYISTHCVQRGRMPIKVIDALDKKYGIDPKAYVLDMMPKLVSAEEPVAETVSSDVIDGVLFEVRHVSDIGETMYKKLNATTDEQTEMMREMIKLLKSIDKSCAYLMRAWEH